MDDIPLDTKQILYYQHDGLPTNRPIHWPASSPDLTLLYFYHRGYFKGGAYKEKPTSLEDMKSKCSIRNYR